jgi:hypothetical protein
MEAAPSSEKLWTSARLEGVTSQTTVIYIRRRRLGLQYIYHGRKVLWTNLSQCGKCVNEKTKLCSIFTHANNEKFRSDRDSYTHDPPPQMSDLRFSQRGLWRVLSSGIKHRMLRWVNRRFERTSLISTCFMLVSCLVYSSTEATYSSETSGDFQRTTRGYIQEEEFFVTPQNTDLLWWSRQYAKHEHGAEKITKPLTTKCHKQYESCGVDCWKCDANNSLQKLRMCRKTCLCAERRSGVNSSTSY